MMSLLELDRSRQIQACWPLSEKFHVMLSESDLEPLLRSKEKNPNGPMNPKSAM